MHCIKVPLKHFHQIFDLLTAVTRIIQLFLQLWYLFQILVIHLFRKVGFPDLANKCINSIEFEEDLVDIFEELGTVLSKILQEVLFFIAGGVAIQFGSGMLNLLQDALIFLEEFAKFLGHRTLDVEGILEVVIFDLFNNVFYF